MKKPTLWFRTPRLAFVALLAAFNLQVPAALAQGTAFTYQGRLNGGSGPATGLYDFRFRLAADAQGNNYVGNTYLTNAVPVTNGLFNTAMDFGTNLFAGPARWLEVDVKTNGAANYSPLSPLQALSPTPYAIFANTASNVIGSVAVSQLAGTVPLAQLPVTVVTNGAVGVNLTGSFSGSLNGNASSATTAGTALTAAVASNVVAGVAITNAIFTNSIFAGNGAGLTNVNLGALNLDGLLTWPGNFSLISAPTLGSFGSYAGSQGVAVADVNGDGKPDLISMNTYDNSLLILTNNGSGGFVPAATNAVGNSPISAVAADVNGDGKLDLICANYADNTLTVLTNNRSGRFAPASTNAVGLSPFSVVAADVNGDGKMDLICANSGTNTLTILTNNGSGGFVLAAAPIVGKTPMCVAAADVNGDGKMDLISANYGDNTLTVLTNNGTGGFVVAATLGVGQRPCSVAAADVNGDGKVDLISANYGSSLTVLTNNGSGGFVTASTLSDANSPFIVVAADVNGDGKVDLISLSAVTYWGVITVQTNNGNGSFAVATAFDLGGLGPTYRGNQLVAAADVNGDGKVDLLCVDTATSTVFVYWNMPALTGSLQGSFTGDGSGLTGLNAGNLSSGTVPLAQLPSAVVTNNEGGATLSNLTLNGLTQVKSNLFMNDKDIQFRTDLNHGIGWYGSSKPFAGATPDGPIVYGFAGGGLGTVSSGSSSNLALTWNSAGNVLVKGTLSANGSSAGGSSSVALGNQTIASASYAAVGGGANNAATGAGAVVAGGGYDGSVVSTNLASGPGSTVSGGTQNTAGGSRSAIGGGHDNQATNYYATIPGGAWNIAGGQGSFAAGQSARALHDGSFVWNCDWYYSLSTTAANQFLARAEGGFYFYTGNGSGGATLAAGATAWSVLSDRNAKKDFAAIQPVAILDKLAALPITQWHYLWEAPGTTPHIGPMAQDFKAAFYPGSDDKSISTLEADGVELAAIQGLNAKVESDRRQAESKLAELKAENAALQAQLAELKALVQKLAQPPAVK